MVSSPETRFLYHASAVACGGRITRPCCDFLESQAASVLPIVGGKSCARVENFCYSNNLISFRTACSTVCGYQSDGGTYHTLATVAIEGLNVCDMVTAERVVARLVSEKTDNRGETPIRPVGSYFTNLRIAGRKIEVEDDENSLECESFCTLRQRMIDQENLETGGNAPDESPEDAGDQTGDLISTSLFHWPKSQEAAGSFTVFQSTDILEGISVRGFGTVYLGEYLVAPSSRRLAMIRIEMGSPVEGSIVFAATEGNGTTY